MELFELITEKNVSLNQIIATWEDEILLAGRLLEEQGFIQKQYTLDMIQMVKDLGPYIVIMPNVAFAHARPKGNVKRNSIAIVTTKTGVSFGNHDNDPVYVLFAIAAKTDEEHLKIFQILASYLSDKENVEIIRNAKTFNDLKLIKEDLQYE